jgi:hypothetical protein
VDASSVLAAVVGGAFSLLLITSVIGWATRNVDRPEAIDLWARTRGVHLTAHNTALLRWYVPLAGTLRVVGAVSGAVIGSLADRALGLDTSAGAGFWAWVALGWVSGGWWAAEQVARSLPPADGAALLVARTSSDYAPGIARWGPFGAAALLLATAIGAAMATGTRSWALASTVVAVGVPLLQLHLAHRVVGRRQPAAHPDVIAADDAIRSATLHLLGAGTTAALLLAAAALWLGVGDQVRGLPFGARGWLPLALLLGAYVTSTYLANRPWRVRRDPAPGRLA